MKTFTLPAFLAIAALLTPAARADHHAKPVDLGGSWEVRATDGSGNDREFTWTIEKDGEKHVGKSVAASDGAERTLDRISVDGSKVAIEIDVEQDGTTAVILIALEATRPGRLAGKWTVESDGNELMSGELVAEKDIRIAYAGGWSAVGTLPDGSEGKAELHVEGENDDLKAVVRTEDGDEVEVSQIRGKDSDLRFEVSIPYEGNAIDLVVEAVPVSSDRLEGVWIAKGPDGAEVAKGDWVAERLAAPSLVGTWDVVGKTGDGSESKALMHVKDSGEGLTATVKTESGNEIAASSVRAGGRDVRIAVTIPYEGNDIDFVVEAAFAAEDRLEGVWIAKGPDGSEAARGDWLAERHTALDLAGEWDLEVTTPDGDIAGTLSFEKTDDGYSGSIASDQGSVDFSSIEVEGQSATLVFPWQDGTITMQAAPSDEGGLGGTWMLVDSGGSEVAGDSWTATRRKD